MGVEVNVQDQGVEVRQVDKDKRVYLSKDAWQILSECRHDVEKALEKGEEFQYTLDAVKDIRVHTNKFNDKMYAHIRFWWRDRPTKIGVSMLYDDWHSCLAPHLTRSPETKLGVAVMKRMVEQKMREAMHEACEGCVHGWPSQRDHECLMERKALATSVAEKIDIAPKDFIMQLAKEACKEDIVLEMPHQTYKRVLLFHMSTIKEEMLEELD